MIRRSGSREYTADVSAMCSGRSSEFVYFVENDDARLGDFWRPIAGREETWIRKHVSQIVPMNGRFHVIPDIS
jgi:hypothetical protein